jgi:small subunit ribosomal protein S20
MPIHKSAKTRVRRNARRNDINTARVSKTRSGLRKINEAIAAGKYEEARAALKAAQPDLQRSADKGLLHKKTASRKLSRLSAQIKKLKK